MSIYSFVLNFRFHIKACANMSQIYIESEESRNRFSFHYCKAFFTLNTTIVHQCIDFFSYILISRNESG